MIRERYIKFKKKKIVDYLSATVLSVFMILAQYDLPLMSIGVVLLLLVSVILLFKYQKIVVNKGMLTFITFSLIQQFIVYSFSDTWENNINTYLFMVIALFILSVCSLINKEYFSKIYSVVGGICAAVIIVQFIQIFVFGMTVSPFLFFNIADENLHYWNMISSRPVAFFTEPQAFCSYIIPLLLIKIKEKNKKWSIYLSTAIMCSGSSQGILVMIFIWSYYYAFCEKRTNSKLSFFFLGIVALGIIFESDVFDAAIEKIMAINITGYDIRLTKGFMIYSEMPIIDKIMGIGFGNLTNYLKSGIFDFAWIKLTRPELLGYVTTMSDILISFGFIGFLFYINIFWENWTADNESKLLLVVLLLISFSQTILFNAWFIYYWVVFFAMDSKTVKRYFLISFRTGKKRFAQQDNVRCEERDC